MSNFLAPADLAKAFVGVSKAKAGKSFAQLFVLGILAGVFIGFAAHLATTVATGWTIGGSAALFGLKKFFIGAVFSTGLMLVIIPGSELWTGNNLMMIGALNKDITFGKMLRNWGIVYLGNLVGSIFLAWVIAKMSGLTGGVVGGTAINIAYGKVAATVDGGTSHNMMYFFRAIGCNWLVCLAVMMAVAAKDIGGKVLAIFFPIMAFVTSGFEHAIANMYFIPAGIYAKTFPDAVSASGKSLSTLTSLNWGSFFTENLISVTIGNFVGGAILCATVYWWLFVKGSK
ncbi:MAG: formate/nitrite transporter family protein [Candidatus Cloacimonetes bacterium]|nr:formate/nitrite transporter family protein [Candidatus Cloacimonadota bacterium]